MMVAPPSIALPSPAAPMPRFRTLALLALTLLVGSVVVVRRPQVVFQEGTGDDRIRIVERSDGVRELYLGSGRGRQTALHPSHPERLELPYTRVAMAGLALVPADGRVLFVGLGGGAMPRYTRWLLPEAHIQVVELEPRVVAVAREWFDFRTDSLLQVHVDDGRAFIEASVPGSWDLVVLDAFSGSRIPPSLATREFLQAVATSLAPDGAVLSNLHTTLPEYDAMVATYRDVFPEVVLLDVPLRRQKILVAGPESLLARDSLLARVRALVSRNDPGFRLEGLVRGGYERARRVDAPVLVDGDGTPPD